MKKTIFIIILVTGLFSYISLTAQTIAEPPSNFDDPTAGTEENPFLISNLANLRWLSETPIYWGSVADSLKYYFLQTDDIDAGETTEHRWYSIGVYSNPFHGYYDGNNKKIENIVFGHQETVNGLFGTIVRSTLIRINLSNATTINRSYTTGLLGRSAISSEILSCSVQGYISHFNHHDVVNPYNAISFYVGGMFWEVSNSLIEFCYVDVSGTLAGPYVIFGSIAGSTIKSIIRNSYVIARPVTLSSGFVEYYGLVTMLNGGYSQNFTIIENCYVRSVDYYGNNRGFVFLASNFYPIRSPDPRPVPVEITNCFWDVETTGLTLPMGGDLNYAQITAWGLPTADMKQANTYFTNGWDFETVWAINPEFNDGYPFIRSIYPDVEHIPGNSNLPYPRNVTLSYRENDFILKWGRPFTLNEIFGYNVYRDNVLLAATAAIDTFFIESQILPEDNYLYEIKTLYDQGIESNPVQMLISAPYPNVQPARYPSFYAEHLGGTQHYYRLAWIEPESNSIIAGYSIICRRLSDQFILHSTFTEENFLESVFEHGQYVFNRRFEVTAIYGGGLESSIAVVNCTWRPEIDWTHPWIIYEINQNTVRLTWTNQFVPFIPGQTNEYYHIYRDGVKLTEGMPLIYNFFEDELSATGTYTYSLTMEFAHFYETQPPVTIEVPFEFVSKIDEETPAIETKLIGNYPNPFNPETTISFSTSKKENVEIIIFNIKGQKVITLINEIYDKGKHTIDWKGTDDNNQKASSGIYFYRMKTEDKTQIKKMVLLK